jgi:hypothetical protein
MTGLPVWAQFNQISPSNFDPGTAYVVADLHLMDNREPFIYKTTDFGATWTKINGDIPHGHPLDYMMSIAENPNKKGMIFAGTGHAFYYSMDDGAHWKQFKTGLPPAPVSWITIQKNYHDVVISTYGRGLYIMPDITVLENTGQTTPPPATTQLFPPRAGIRNARNGSAEFEFTLAKAPDGPVQMEILDPAGKLLKKLQVSAHDGLNKATWNLQMDGPVLVALRTTPPENPHIWEEPRFLNRDTRGITHWGITAGTGVPLAAPGKYQVRMTIDGKPYTAPFQIVKDQAIAASDADLVESSTMQIQIRDDITSTSDIVNRIEVMRKQLEDAKKANAAKAAVVKGIDDMDKKLYGVELQLVTKSEMLSDDKYFPEAYKVYMNLIWFSGAVGQGASDEAGGVDFKPTDTQHQVLVLLEKALAKAKTDFGVVTTTDVPAFNTWAAANGLKPLSDK